MLTRSLSYYTLSKPARSSLDFEAPLNASSMAPPSQSGMPRSTSMQKLNYMSSNASSTPLGILRPQRTSTTVELVEEVASVSVSPTPTPFQFPAASGEGSSLPTENKFIPSSTSPEGYLQTEAGSLPISLQHPIMGNALLHPPPINGGGSAPLMVEDFEILGRAGESTCDSWIVRSKGSGKMALFKPRDGEQFEQRRREQEEEQEKRERAERDARRRKAQGLPPNDDLVDLTSSPTPIPLSLCLPTSNRTPIRRGILYGETTRKEVAAYLMDHEHFAGVPKTIEATIWLNRSDAPNGGVNRDEHSGIENYHPYLHGSQSSALALAPASPDLMPQGSPTRLLLKPSTNSPALSASEPQFAFDSEEVWVDGVTNVSPVQEQRSLFGMKQQHNNSSATALVASSASEFTSKQMLPTARKVAPLHDLSNLSPPTLLHAPTAIVPASNLNNLTPLSPTESSDFSPFAPPSPNGSPLESSYGIPTIASDLVATYGSLQEFVENGGSAEDMGSNVFSTEEVHRIGVLDVRLLNLDRHLGNLLVQHDKQGKPHLIPIDHGLILPAYQELSDVHLEWTYWRQCQEPFSEETRRYIEKLDPIADAAKLRALGIRDEALVSMVFSSLLVKHAAAEGLTLFHIAKMVQRDPEAEEDEPSTLETIVARVLGSHAQDGDGPSASPEAPSRTVVESDSPIQMSSNGVLHSVEEEGLASPLSSISKRFDSQSEVPSSPFNSPPATPHISTISSVSTQSYALISPQNDVRPSQSSLVVNRSNSDGVMGQSELVDTGRQSSCPPPDKNVLSKQSSQEKERESPLLSSKSSSKQKPMQIPRRPSVTQVADGAKHLMSLVDDANHMLHSPSLNGSSGPASASASFKASNPFLDEMTSNNNTNINQSDLKVTSPPAMIRLGTELTLHDPAIAAANAAAAAAGENSTAGGIPTGAGLQRLLQVTEAVICEELVKYRARNGLEPSPIAASPTASVVTPSKPFKPTDLTVRINNPPAPSPKAAFSNSSPISALRMPLAQRSQSSDSLVALLNSATVSTPPGGGESLAASLERLHRSRANSTGSSVNALELMRASNAAAAMAATSQQPSVVPTPAVAPIITPPASSTSTSSPAMNLTNSSSCSPRLSAREAHTSPPLALIVSERC